jgi:hypothetical protein
MWSSANLNFGNACFRSTKLRLSAHSLVFLLLLQYRYHCPCPSPCQVKNLGRSLSAAPNLGKVCVRNSKLHLSTHFFVFLLSQCPFQFQCPYLFQFQCPYLFQFQCPCPSPCQVRNFGKIGIGEPWERQCSQQQLASVDSLLRFSAFPLFCTVPQPVPGA